jgi:hypothetical protein
MVFVYILQIETKRKDISDVSIKIKNNEDVVYNIQASTDML